MKAFFFLLLIFSSLHAEVLKYEVSGLQKRNFDYKEVCKELGIKHLLMVNAINTRKLDCMGTEVDVALFCEQRFGGRSDFLRSYVNKNMQEVVCEMGKSARLTIACNKQDRKWCKQPEKSCHRLKDYYARNLELVYQSFEQQDVDDVLNCYYTLKTEKEKDLHLSNMTLKAPQDWEIELKNDQVFRSLDKKRPSKRMKQAL